MSVHFEVRFIVLLYKLSFQILEALNKGEIPSTGSLLEVFNKGILDRYLKLYGECMGNLSLPTSNDYLHNAHEASREAAMNAFNEQHFGRYHAKRSVEKLVEDIEKVLKLNISLAAVILRFFAY